MTTRERILAIKLLEGNRKNPEFFKEIRIEFSQYQGLISDIEAKGLERAEEQNIYKLAEDNVKNIMDEFLAVFDGYEVVYM